MRFEFFKWGGGVNFLFWVNNNVVVIGKLKNPDAIINFMSIDSSFTRTIYRRYLRLLIQMFGKGQIIFPLIYYCYCMVNELTFFLNLLFTNYRKYNLNFKNLERFNKLPVVIWCSSWSLSRVVVHM